MGSFDRLDSKVYDQFLADHILIINSYDSSNNKIRVTLKDVPEGNTIYSGMTLGLSKKSFCKLCNVDDDEDIIAGREYSYNAGLLKESIKKLQSQKVDKKLEAKVA